MAYSWTQKPLGVLPTGLWVSVLWVTFTSLWLLTSQLQPGQPYPSPLLLSLSNLWLLVLALLTMSRWSQTALASIFTACFWSGAALISYGWIQVLNLDQFFLQPSIPHAKDVLVGTVGNATHFACQLALWVPLALSRSGWQRAWALPALGLIVLAGSSTALVVAVGCLLAWIWRTNRVRAGLLGLLSVVSGVGLVLATPSWLNPFGRWTTWTTWWEQMVLQRPIVGWGLGFTKQFSQSLPGDSPIAHWRHLHNEYLQWWVETGLIGVGLLVWVGWQLWRRREETEPSTLRWTCGMLLCASLGIATLNFSWHLWQLGVFGLVGLAGWLVCTEPMERRLWPS